MPYINTIDINGTIYNLENLTDGENVVDLPDLNGPDIFLLRGDVVDSLTNSQEDKPLSANQGRVLDGDIRKLRTDMDTGDTLTLSTANSYTDEQSADALSKAKQHTDTNCTTINETITALQGTVDKNKQSLDQDISDLTKLVETKSSETLTAAQDYTDSKCDTINNTIADLRETVENNKSASDTTFVAKTNIADNLTTDSSEKVLSAKQGKVLEEKKVDKVSGKGLSTNDYTTEEKNKLNAIEAEANKYVHPKYTAQSSGLYKIIVDSTGHVSAVTLATKDDITALGIPAQDTVYILPPATKDVIGGVKIDSDYVLGADDVAASTNAVLAAYEALSSKCEALSKRIEALEKQNPEATV